MSSWSLLPRVRVNYTLGDLFRSLFISESGHTARNECESHLAHFFDNESVCLTPSGRDAIYEVLIRKPHKKVVMPAYTCMAVVEAVKLAGKEIVYSETDPETYNSQYLDKIDADSIVLATHQYGLPCNIKKIADKCSETGAILIEDCATSMGTTVDGRITGTFGDYAIVSFNASKLLNVPPCGGSLISKDKEMMERISKEAEWKDSNLSFKYKSLFRGLVFVLTKNPIIYKLFHYLLIDSKGKLQLTEHEKPAEKKTDLYKYKFSEWQATILLKQLRNIDGIISKRKQMYAYYDKAIENPLVKKPVNDENAVCCRYAIQVEKRNEFYHKCVKEGVDMDFSHCTLGCPDTFINEHQMAEHVLNVPFNTEMTETEIKHVVSVINSIQ